MPDTDKIANNFNNLPMESLIGAPLVAAGKSNIQLALATYEFISTVWYEKDSDPAKGGKARMLKFPLERSDETGQKRQFEVNAPLAALIETPNLMVRNIDIQFNMEVKDTVKNENSVDTKVGADFNVGGLNWGLKLSGSLTTHTNNTRETDQSAKYEIRLNAGQASPTEGMNRLSQVFASVIEPMPLGNSKGN
ncbi:alpha-amylase [Undibacterium sp. KW1]|uniref:DUF2589 domain-containing protein n=1 Tax=Undibacterium sp. KW1 TaxID=2058624 RepID=UPI001331CFEE|nr:DUF2589 domain-containing protein [Undibacterium sp. KW1]BBB58294.1 alpha-amylase [Undibacterium sp. KW1]